jgi:guanyl-specific ribonuclease Sa
MQRQKPLSFAGRGPWRWVALVVLLLAIAASRFAERPAEPPADSGRPTVEAPQPPDATKTPRPREAVEFHDLTIRDEEGRVAYRGTVDLSATLERIAAGKRLRYANDGSTFENREGRLPKKGSGHYREYIHPTPGLSGPGPQRIVVGNDGATYYTPDHYRSFRPVRESQGDASRN